MELKRLDETDMEKTIKERYEWPFKTLEVKEGVEIKDGYQGKDLLQLKSAAHSYGRLAGKKFRTRTEKRNGVIKIFRTE